MKSSVLLLYDIVEVLVNMYEDAVVRCFLVWIRPEKMMVNDNFAC